MFVAEDFHNEDFLKLFSFTTVHNNTKYFDLMKKKPFVNRLYGAVFGCKLKSPVRITGTLASLF